MPKHSRQWIVMADGSRARVVARRREGPGFDVVFEMSSAEAHLPSREIWADRPGRTQESGNSARHSIEPRHDPHEERKIAFLHDLAARLNAAGGEELFDSLIVFAPPRCLGELRAKLDELTQAKVKASAPKDLTKLPLSELSEHLEALAQLRP